MASPQLLCETYRISEVPPDISEEDVKAWFPPSDRALILKISSARMPHPSSLTCQPQVFIVTFSKQSQALNTVRPNTEARLLGHLLTSLPPGCEACCVDAHFAGLTPLNNGPDGPDAVDLVAVTGIGGRPFGSWQCENTSMWLRDFLPIDVPRLKVFVYGHRLKVFNSDQHSSLKSCAEGLLQDLKSIRQEGSRKPLILLGHSVGGLVIKYAWILSAENSKNSDQDRALYDAIDSLIFFGTPHQGYRNEEIIDVVTGQPSEPLVRDLGPRSSFLKELRDRFASLGAHQRLRVLSCCEYRETPTSQIDPQGSVRRDGPRQWMVNEESAILHWNKEKVVPMNENHSTMAKLSRGISSKYHVIKGHIDNFANGAAERVPKRFYRNDAAKNMARVNTLMRTLTIEASSTPSAALQSHNACQALILQEIIENEGWEKCLMEDRFTSETAFGFAAKTSELSCILESWKAGRSEVDVVIPKAQDCIQSMQETLLPWEPRGFCSSGAFKPPLSNLASSQITDGQSAARPGQTELHAKSPQPDTYIPVSTTKGFDGYLRQKDRFTDDETKTDEIKAPRGLSSEAMRPFVTGLGATGGQSPALDHLQVEDKEKRGKESGDMWMMAFSPKDGNMHPLEVKLDSGSKKNFITEDIVLMLELQKRPLDRPEIFTGASARFSCTCKVDLQWEGLDREVSRDEFIVLPAASALERMLVGDECIERFRPRLFGEKPDSPVA